VVAVAFEARAQADEVTAQTAYDHAEQLAKAGKWADACPLFESSYKADPQLGVLISLAACHEHVGRTATAWAEFRHAEDLARKKADDERMRYAHERVERLEARLPRLRVTASKIAGLVVTLDGADITALVGTDMPVDPGDHAVVARAPGYVESKQSTNAAEAKTTQLAIAPLAKTAAPTAAATIEATAPARVAPPHRFQLVGYARAGITLAGAQATSGPCAPPSTMQGDPVLSPAGIVEVGARRRLGDHFAIRVSVALLGDGASRVLGGGDVGSGCSPRGGVSGAGYGVLVDANVRLRFGTAFVGIGPALGWYSFSLSGNLTQNGQPATYVANGSFLGAGGTFDFGTTFGTADRWEVAFRIGFVLAVSPANGNGGGFIGLGVGRVLL